MPRLLLRPLLFPVLLVAACREEPLEPKSTDGPTTSPLAAASGGWTVQPPMPTARFLHAAEVADNADGQPTFFVFGGTDGEVDGFRSVEAYDPATDETDLYAP